MERVGEDLISAMEGQVSCRGGRKFTSNLEKTGSASKGGGKDGTVEKPGPRQREENLVKELEKV